MAATETAYIRRTLTRRCAKLGIPVCGTFELTPRCNLQCKMCYIRLTPEQMNPIGRELTATEWLHLARQAHAAGMCSCCSPEASPQSGRISVKFTKD